MAKTDFSNSPCAFSEAPAESIFSTYAWVAGARESMTIDHAVALTRIACHGPSVATPEARALAEEAIEQYASIYGPLGFAPTCGSKVPHPKSLGRYKVRSGSFNILGNKMPCFLYFVIVFHIIY